MAFFNRKDIDELSKVYKINLINSCSGFKSANLLGSISIDGTPNVAIFKNYYKIGELAQPISNRYY